MNAFYNTIVAACNESIDYESMAGIQRITNQYNDKIVNDYIAFKQWKYCEIKVAEALILLDLLKYAKMNISDIQQGKLKFVIDNRLLQRIIKEV